MYKRISKFYLENPSGEVDFLSSNGITADKCVIVTTDESRIIRNKYHIMDVHFAREEKYGLSGDLFVETTRLNNVLRIIKIEEIK